MPVNWVLEAKKWHLLISRWQSFTMKDALRSVTAGVSLAILTPGRIGEYGGRLVGVHSENRSKALLSNFLCSISQNILNLGIGIIAATLFLKSYIDVPSSIYWIMTAVGSVLLILMIVVFLRIDVLDSILRLGDRFKMVQSIRKNIQEVSQLSLRTRSHLLGISSIRYFIYSLQYVLLVLFFGVTGQWEVAVLGVATIFFLQSNLPLPPAFSVFARGEIAILLWSVFTTNSLGILAATFLLWIINLILPAIAGMFVLSRVKN